MNIVFITTVSFPFGSATSSRTRNLVRLFIAAGHSVHVISEYDSNEDFELNKCTHESIIRKPYENKTNAELSLMMLKKYYQDNAVDVVCLNAKSDRFLIVNEFCKQKGIKFVVENCEWYDPSNYRFNTKDKEYIANQKMIKEDFQKADGFISISRLLDNHNKTFGKPSIRIPTILDVRNTHVLARHPGDRIKLVYTGRPGKSKEYLGPILKAILFNKHIREKIEFDIYGVNLLQLLRNINYNVFLYIGVRKNVHLHGNVNQKWIKDVIGKSDFQIFIRPDRQSSNAGFPTKLGESMMVGTPVISNITGDIGLYLNDGENGIALKGNGRKETEEGLLRVLKMSNRDIVDMRISARACAEKNFDYRNYVTEIKQFLQEI